MYNRAVALLWVLDKTRNRPIVRCSGVTLRCLSLFLAVAANFGVFAKERSAEIHPFTVAEEIGVAHFGDPYMLKTQAITESPNGKYVAIETERGLLQVNRVEDELRIYSMEALRSFLELHVQRSVPRPLWAIRESTYSGGPLIQQIGWLRNSSGVTFLLTNSNGQNQLVVALIKARTVKYLTADAQDVMSYDVRDLTHYVYAVRDLASWRRAARDRSAASFDATGRSLYDLLFPLDEYPRSAQWRETRSQLWAAVGGARQPVLNRKTGKTVVLFQEGQWAMRLAPDGYMLETVMPVQQIPLSWRGAYQPPFRGSPNSLRPGRQNLDGLLGERLVSEYVNIDLKTGRIRPHWSAYGRIRRMVGWGDGSKRVGSRWGGSYIARYLCDRWLGVSSARAVRGCCDYFIKTSSMRDALYECPRQFCRRAFGCKQRPVCW